MNIFEELMTGQSTLNESVSRKSQKTTNKESKKIPANKIKVESMKILEEYDDYDELDDEFATISEDNASEDIDNLEDGEVVLVIDPEASTEEEIPEDAAQDMIGDSVYKCPVCGANYVCDCDAETEGLEVDENGVPVECPVCGDDSDQILIGEIAPIEGAGEEDTLDAVEPDDAERNEEIFDEDEVDVDVEDEDEEVIEDSVKRRRASRRTESRLHRPRRRVKEDIDETDIVDIDDEEDMELVEPIIDEPVIEEKSEKEIKIDAERVFIDFDDTKFESLMSSFLRENYKNNPSFKITKGRYRNNVLTLEYVIRSGKKTLKTGRLNLEGYNSLDHKRTVSLRGRDKGAFTESFTRTPAFIVECVCVRDKVIPTALKYDFKKKVNESLYRVKGNVGKIRKENLGTDLGEYQKWVDYDMKRYGKISKKTNDELKKAGLKVVKDEYGDWEVMESITNKSKRRVNEGLTITRSDAEGEDCWNGPNEYNTGNISYTYWDKFWKSELSSALGKTLWSAEEFDDRSFKKFKDLITKYYNGDKKLKDYVGYGSFISEIYDVIKDCNSPEDIKIW